MQKEKELAKRIYSGLKDLIADTREIDIPAMYKAICIMYGETSESMTPEVAFFRAACDGVITQGTYLEAHQYYARWYSMPDPKP